MNSSESFIQTLENRGKPAPTLELAREVLDHYHDQGQDSGFSLESVRSYCARYIAGKPDAADRIVILFWYADHIRSKEAGTYLVTLLGTLGVIESQRRRLVQLYGEEAAVKVFSELTMPQLGTDLNAYPQAINSYLQRMAEVLEPAACRKVLAGNHHDVNPDAFREDKELWQKSGDMDEFLRQKHQRLVASLQEHADTGKLWFEQYITQDVVDYVKEHQEIQTGIRQAGRIIVRKIPYNPEAWLRETDPLLKRFHACHCPFSRFSILTEMPVADIWCYCSGGFTKLFFDYLFDRDLEVELLESVLSGAESCRFAIRLPE
jgi:hypothetical protein